MPPSKIIKSLFNGRRTLRIDFARANCKRRRKLEFMDSKRCGLQTDLTFSASAADYLQYGAATSRKSFGEKTPSTSTTANSNSLFRSDTKAVYQKWLDDDVRYIATDERNNRFPVK
jgi:hypothetical protein